MSIPLKLSSINEPTQNQIYQQLNIKPVQKFFRKKQYWKKNDTKPSIPAYSTRPDTDSIFVPYYYGQKMLGTNPHFTRQYPASYAGWDTSKVLYDYQQIIIQEATQHLNIYGTTTLNIYTGSGKTVMGSYLGTATKLIQLVAYEDTGLVDSWIDTYKEFTNASIYEVPLQEKPIPPGTNVILCMTTRIHKIPPAILEQVGTLIIDEAHNMCTRDHFAALLRVNPKFIIAATATLKREDKLHLMIHAMCGPHIIFRKSTKPFYVCKFNTGVSVPIINNKLGDPDYSKIVHQLSCHHQRNMMILNLVKQYPTHKIMIITKRVDHVKYLYECLLKMGESTDYMCEKKSKCNECRVIVGNVDKIGTGFDQKARVIGYDGKRIDLLIIAMSIKGDTPLEQAVGRGLRSDFPYIIHMIDNMKMFDGKDGHWNKYNKKWYESRNGTITEAGYKPQELIPTISYEQVAQININIS